MFGKYSSQLVNMYHYSTNNPGLLLVSNDTNMKVILLAQKN